MTSGQVMKAVAAGVVGAAVLTVLHEMTRRRVRHAPRLDIGGMRALARMFRAIDLAPPSRLHRSALVSDLAANAAFYSLAASAGNKSMVAGSLLGLGAGLGAVVLPSADGHRSRPNRPHAEHASDVGGALHCRRPGGRRRIRRNPLNRIRRPNWRSHTAGW